VQKSANYVSLQDCILGIRNPHFGWSVGCGYESIITIICTFHQHI
jgi:hypothetical protein